MEEGQAVGHSTLNVGNLVPGVYLLRITNGDGSTTKKVVVR